MKVNEILSEGLKAQWTPGRIAGLSKQQIKVLVKNATEANDKKVLDMIADINIQQDTKEAAKKATRLSKEEKLRVAQMEKIPKDLSISEIEKIIKKHDGSLGAQIEDIYNTTNIVYKLDDGTTVAGLKCRASVMIDLTDMYDQNTIDTIYDGKTMIDDSMQFTIYRNPAKPKQLLGFVSG